ncbi:MAG: hybrid sensor histidine kinase/response regulator [Caulobacterales bacterium 68-7]|nr:MAG: hybrid sensor histidine kinase/response regulator [Caulobacterales bacterium 68-7]
MSSARRAVSLPSLEAQVSLLPYALGIFAVCLPVYVWAGSFSPNALWMAASFAIFAINWGAFYAVVNWLRTPQAADPARRTRVQLLGGLLWAVAIVQIAVVGDHAGPAREAVLMIAVAGAAACCFFSAPTLAGLLVVGPVAAAGPLIALYARPESTGYGAIAWGALALTLALCLVMNRLLRRQFVLAEDRETLIASRAASLEAAERMARSKSDIVATLSHEIRNGLTGVAHVLAAAAGRGGRGAPSREQLSAALDAAQNLISVLNATLDSETAESGRLAVQREAFNPVQLVDDLALLDRPHALTKGLELTVHADPALDGEAGAAVADPARARQILANLIGNAVKYTTRGRIEVRLERRGDMVAIDVADTGPGLSPDELERAFEPFRRVERTGAGVPGAGLGLSLSRHLAQLMGGRLNASSALGVGSCFTLELPYEASALRVELPSTPTRDSGAVSLSSPLRVLVAEDDALNAAMLRAILEQLGHQVVHAHNGVRAVELARICPFDLMMIDGRMPELDGAGAAAAIRALPGENSSVPIIAVIGGDADEATECLEAGADTVLRKPVTVGGVARAVAEASAEDRQSVAASAPRLASA